jgi:ABC-2 type transport system ATP-binding protein
LILSTHIMQEVEAICDQVVIINKGKIVAADQLKNLKAQQGKSRIHVETEEKLDLEWFASIGDPVFLNSSNTAVSILASDPVTARKEILQVVQAKNLNLVRIQQAEHNLEYIFHQITQS